MAAVERIVVDRERRQLQIVWNGASDVDDGDDVIVTSRYPFVWLRDSCRCSGCFHPDAKGFRTSFEDLDIDCEPESAQLTDNGDVKVTWSDGHVSTFKSAWLKRMKFVAGPLKTPESECQLWGSEFQLPRFDFVRLLNDDAVLLDWISTLRRTGLCLLYGAPSTAGQIQLMGQRVAYLHKIHYGETFTVKSKPNPSNVAYTTARIAVHVDLPYNEFVPGIQLLHCIAQAKVEGGDSQFVDGFHVASQLRQQHPDDFRVLTTTPVGHYDVGKDFLKAFEFRCTHRTIETDMNGRPTQIVFSNHTRDREAMPRDVSLDEVDGFYRALKQFYGLLNSPDNIINYKLLPGEIVCFDNHRVLHARSAFKVADGDERHLEGGYMDWDEMLSKKRSIERQLSAVADTRNAAS